MYFLKILGIVLILVTPLFGVAQLQNVVAFGSTKDWPGTRGLSSVKVEVLVNNKPVDQVISGKSGKFEIKLFYEKQYQLRFSKSGYVTKLVEVDTRNIPPEEKTKGEFYTNKMLVDMIPIRECLDYADAEKQPVGRYAYDKTNNDIELDVSDQKRVQALFNKVKKQYHELDDLQLLVDEGDRAMRGKQFKQAAKQYQKAVSLCTANDRIMTKRDSARYRIKISIADSLFGIHKYKRARSEYVKALTYETWRMYPDQKIAEIDGLTTVGDDDDPPISAGDDPDVSGDDVGATGGTSAGSATLTDIVASPEGPKPTVVTTDNTTDVDNSTPTTHPIKTTKPDPNVNLSPTASTEPKHKKPVRYYDPKEKLEIDRSGQHVQDRTGTSQEKWDKIQQAKNRRADAAATLEEKAAADRTARADSLQQVQHVSVDPNDKFKDQTVSEEITEEGQKTIVTRTVVRSERTFVYKKVSARWGVFYFRDGNAIAEHTWERETGGK